MQYLKAFVLSEGARYQELQLASNDLKPRSVNSSSDDGLDGWSFMMRTAAKDFALLYFELKAEPTQVTGFTPNTPYRWLWYDPRHGTWSPPVEVTADAKGTLSSPAFPSGVGAASLDWAAKVIRAN